MKNKVFYYTLLIASSCSLIKASMALIRPYDTLTVRRLIPEKNWNLSGTNAGGTKTFARAEEGTAKSLQIWQCAQNGLAMLNGFSPDSPIGMLNALVDATDNGIRGIFIPKGTLELHYTGIFAAQARIHREWRLGFYLPVYATALTDVRWIDKTESLNSQDARVKQYLSESLGQLTESLGGLYIGPWHRAGVGDLVTTIEWAAQFPQSKPFLKNVEISLLLGLNFPTGKKEDYDKLLAFAYGYDGSWAIPMGIGIKLLLSKQLTVGADVQLTVIFGNTRNRRIKTAFSQTDLLLLQKAPVYRDPGLDQCFNLYTELHAPYGVSLMLAYQYYKHGEDMYIVKNNCFSSNIANSAERLQDWTAHSWIVDASYQYYTKANQAIIPRVDLFARVPFNGRRSIMFTTFGGGISINF